VEKSLAAGFAMHLVKPVQFQKLEEAIAMAMNAPGRIKGSPEGPKTVF